MDTEVVVFGSTGMLGNYVNKYLIKKGFNVKCIPRCSLDARFVTSQIIKDTIKRSVTTTNVTVVNCIGLIKPTNATPQEYILVNSLFPHLLEEACLSSGWKLIHASTDCVFDSRGNYNETDMIDATDIYGLSKAAGEPRNSTVIRTSIIGGELNHKYSLLEWVISNAHKTVKGFKNHIWNGITCLQFAVIVEKIILENLYWKGPRHIFSPVSITKCELVKLISTVFNLAMTVEEVNAERDCNKVLCTVYDPMPVPDIKTQIEQLFLFPLV